VAASVLAGNESAPSLQHWQAHEIKLVTEPQQSLQIDGDVVGKTPLTAKILSKATHVIVPKPRPAPAS
jgi:diacylglycerol kinase family enzyme